MESSHKFFLLYMAHLVSDQSYPPVRGFLMKSAEQTLLNSYSLNPLLISQ